MITLTEPIPIQEGPNATYHYYVQLRELFDTLMNVSFTSRDGAIQHDDKAGNLDAKWIVFTSNSTANTEDAITHDLGRTPVGILVALPDKAATIYSSSTAWTSTTIYVKTTTASVAWKLLAF